MTLEEIHNRIQELTTRIHVLESEKVDEKYVQPLYFERNMLLNRIIKAQGDV
jgi:hypothetical protein